MKKTLIITDEHCDLLEGLAYEVAAYQDLLTCALSMGLEDTPGYEKEKIKYVETRAEYELAKKRIISMYTNEDYDNLIWSISYGTKVLEYEVLDDE